MPKYSEDENDFWTELMYSANYGIGRICRICYDKGEEHYVVPLSKMLRHSLVHKDKTVYEIWSPYPIKVKTGYA